MPELDLFTVAPTDSIRAAMEKIEKNKHRVVVVVDEALHVLGTVSDGDVRRAFLQDALPITPVQQIMNLNCRTTTERDEKKLATLIRRAKVTVLPVVTKQNKLVTVFLAHEPFTSSSARGRNA